MFSPTLNFENLKVPYVSFVDYTMSLAKKYPPSASPPTEIDKWLNLEKMLFKNSRLIITPCQNTKNSIINDYGVDSKKIIDVNYGIPENIEPNNKKSYSEDMILFIGRFFKQKGGYTLLDAFKQVREEIPNAKLVIVGPNEKALIKKSPGVKVYGFIKDRNIINNFFEKSSVFVMPSYSEAFGLVFLEAMIHKLPCIGSTVDAIPEIIIERETGFLIEPDDVKDLSNKIIKLLKNPELSKNMGLKGYERAKSLYNWDEFGDKIDKKLLECLNNN
jgi:glycosyltransferase involved in cell wall biosynthesis